MSIHIPSSNSELKFENVQVCIVKKHYTEKLLAMKYMNKQQCEENSAVECVFREIEILARLDNPFIVNLWYSFQGK